jgi:MFS family permease
MSATERHRDHAGGVESTYAWLRLAASLALATIGGVGVWSVVVALPAVQMEFGVARASASFPYTLTLLGFAIGGLLMGRLADRWGAMAPVALGAVMIALGYVAAASATSIWQYALAQGLLIGAGSAATFAPLVADTSLWFDRRRGAAVGVIASGNYFAGAIWSPLVQHFIASDGWRYTYYGIAAICLVTMLPLTLVLRRRAPQHDTHESRLRRQVVSLERLGVSPRALQMLLMVAGLSCCVAMSMPQVHMVAYCSDLGYGAARGAEMLALMLLCGVVSRLSWGVISDRIGGVMTVLIGAALQLVSLAMFLPFNDLVSLYLISALFGLFQGGIVPAYAIIVREYFRPAEAGTRVGAVLMMTLAGMSLGGWMTGAIFDVTGSYRAAFVNGMLWNLVTLSIAGWLWWRTRLAMRRPAVV